MKLYKYLSAQYALEYLRTRELKVATLEDVNDPNEWIPCLKLNRAVTNSLSDSMNRAAFKEKWGKRYGFISFSSQFDNSVMWAHYADKSRGITLEFEIIPNASIPVFQVSYLSARYLLDDNEMSKEPNKEQVRCFMAQKDKVWEYESEWRILVELASCSVYPNAVGRNIYCMGVDTWVRFSGVLLGAECQVQFGHVLTAVGEMKERNRIALRRMKFSPTDYSLYVSDECDFDSTISLNRKTEFVSVSGNE